MKKLFLSLLAALSLHAYGDNVYGMENNDTTTIQIIETSDVHGCFFPYDFINRRDLPGSLARVKTYVDRMRAQYGAENVFLLDNGDILQGQPICYYYNYVATGQTNIAAQCTNYLQYDAQTLGNHDVETGHGVYDKWIRESHAPVLGANVIDTRTGKPYTLPYCVLCKDGKVKVAIIGMITPAIPSWLKENLWSGLRFDDMVATARKTHFKPGYCRIAIEATVTLLGFFMDGTENHPGGEGSGASGRDRRPLPLGMGRRHRDGGLYGGRLAEGRRGGGGI